MKQAELNVLAIHLVCSVGFIFFVFEDPSVNEPFPH